KTTAIKEGTRPKEQGRSSSTDGMSEKLRRNARAVGTEISRDRKSATTATTPMARFPTNVAELPAARISTPWEPAGETSLGMKVVSRIVEGISRATRSSWLFCCLAQHAPDTARTTFTDRLLLDPSSAQGQVW